MNRMFTFATSITAHRTVWLSVQYDTITLRWNLDQMSKSWNSIISYGLWYPMLESVNDVRLIEHWFTSLVTTLADYCKACEAGVIVNRRDMWRNRTTPISYSLTHGRSYNSVFSFIAALETLLYHYTPRIQRYLSQLMATCEGCGEMRPCVQYIGEMRLKSASKKYLEMRLQRVKCVHASMIDEMHLCVHRDKWNAS